MGAVIEYRCSACVFTSGHLSIGWGRAGRGKFWGGLARCEPCKELRVINLSTPEPNSRGRRCDHCTGPLTLFEGTQVSIPCPRCNVPLQHQRVGDWA